MEKNKYTLELVSDGSVWDDFVSSSPQGTIFSYTVYLENATNNYKRLFIKKGNQVKAGVALILNKDSTKIILDDLVIHSGVLFADDVTQKVTKARLERFEITEFIIEHLIGSYESIELALSPMIEDMRAFLWHNYHSEDQNNTFKLDLRYTSYLDISSLKDVSQETESQLFKELETLRQRNIREARKKSATRKTSNDPALFVSCYEAMMEEQGSPTEKDKLARMHSLIKSLIDSDLAFLSISLNSAGEPIYATVFCWDNKRAYYLFGAPHPINSERYKGTIAFWDSFHELADRGIYNVDMEGVNSPSRGWFKLSFGGQLLPYYEVFI